MTFLEAAKRVLAEAGTPLTADEITRRALDNGWIEAKGEIPSAMMESELGTQMQSLGDGAEIIMVKPGLWVLREWESVEMGTEEQLLTTPTTGQPQHWLFTTNPEVYDTEDLFREGTVQWGEMITSAVVRKRIREEIRANDKVLVYRTHPLADLFCEMVVVGDPYPSEDTYVVDVRAIRRIEPPVSLQALRACPALTDLEFIRNPRVSISRVSDAEWEAIQGLIGQDVQTETEGTEGLIDPNIEIEREYSHDAIQWMLIRLGKAFGCGVWVASDCRNRVYEGESFADHCLAELPNLGFSRETTDLVRGIDVLWLRGNLVLAAFEIEHTTSIYSGLLRMSDLVSL